MRGYYKNARREDYGPNVEGLDFVVKGLGKFDHITDVEVKGAVSSSIQPKPTLVKQAKKYVNRINYQKNFWSDETAVKEKIPHINPDTDLPKSPDNVLALYDLWDVGTPEKSIVNTYIDDIFDSNMDVSVNLENGQNYVVVVGTPKNLLKLMENKKSDFLSPGDPIVIIKKMTKEVVEEAIKAYAEDNGYYINTFDSNNNFCELNLIINSFVLNYQ